MHSFLLMQQYLGPSTNLSLKSDEFVTRLVVCKFVITGHFYVLGFNSGISKSENGVQF